MEKKGQSQFDKLIERCDGFLADVLKLSQVKRIRDSEPERQESAEVTANKYLSIPELFIVGPGDYDHLIFMTFKGAAKNKSASHFAPLRFIMPEALRSSTKVTSSGLIINDIPMSAYTKAYEAISVILYRIKRGRRTQRLIENIQNFVDALNFSDDYWGSVSLSQAILDRMELFDDSPDTEIVLGSQFVFLDHDAFNEGVHYLVFLKRSYQEEQDGKLWLKNRQLQAGKTVESASPLSNQSYILLRIGDKSNKESIKRYIDELRRKHALKREELNQANESESYVSYVEKEIKRRQEEIEERRLKLINSIYGHPQILTLVTPLALEVASNLEPFVSSANNELAPRFQDFIDQMRNHFLDIYGVSIPGIRVRGNDSDMPIGSYLIMINEVPLVMGTVHPDKGFCDAMVEQLKKMNVDGETATHPDNGREGAWIARDDWEIVKAKGFKIWDLLDYIVLHLQGLIRKNLRDFVGIEEISALLEAESADLFQEIDSASGGIVRFSNVITALLEEELPIKPLDVLAKKYLELIECPAFELSEHLRCIDEIRAYLIQDLSTWRLFHLGKDFVKVLQEHIIRDGDNAILGLEPEITQDALSAVRAEIGHQPYHPAQPVILVEDWRIRPFVKKLIDIEFPQVRVVAGREVAEIKARLLKPVSIITIEQTDSIS